MFMDTQLLIGVSGLITSVATIATLVYATLSFLHAHERQKKQSTIEYYNKIIKSNIYYGFKL